MHRRHSRPAQLRITILSRMQVDRMKLNWLIRRNTNQNPGARQEHDAARLSMAGLVCHTNRTARRERTQPVLARQIMPPPKATLEVPYGVRVGNMVQIE